MHNATYCDLLFGEFVARNIFVSHRASASSSRHFSTLGEHFQVRSLDLAVHFQVRSLDRDVALNIFKSDHVILICGGTKVLDVRVQRDVALNIFKSDHVILI